MKTHWVLCDVNPCFYRRQWAFCEARWSKIDFWGWKQVRGRGMSIMLVRLELTWARARYDITGMYYGTSSNSSRSHRFRYLKRFVRWLRRSCLERATVRFWVGTSSPIRYQNLPQVLPKKERGVTNFAPIQWRRWCLWFVHRQQFRREYWEQRSDHMDRDNEVNQSKSWGRM